MRQEKPLPIPRRVRLSLWDKPSAATWRAELQSSLGPYQDYPAQLAFDGDASTFFWANRGLQKDDPLSVEVENPETPEAVGILLGTDRYRNEYVHAGVLELSPGGQTWTELAELNCSTVSVELPDKPVRALRLRAAKPQPYWLIIREIIFE